MRFSLYGRLINKRQKLLKNTREKLRTVWNDCVRNSMYKKRVNLVLTADRRIYVEANTD